MCQSMITDQSNVISSSLTDDQEPPSHQTLSESSIQSSISFLELQIGWVELLGQLLLKSLLISHHIYRMTLFSPPSGFPPVTFLFSFSSSIPLSASLSSHAILYFPFLSLSVPYLSLETGLTKMLQDLFIFQIIIVTNSDKLVIKRAER